VVHVGSASRLVYRDLQLVVQREGEPEGLVPLEDIAVLICDFAPITVTEPLLTALAEGGVALVVCDARHIPSGLLLPLAGASLHAKVLRDQIAATVPRKKRIWQAIVKAKILAQADVLERNAGYDRGLRALSKAVGSGDPGNCEARAARLYFPALFGAAFIRDPERTGVNAMLNYGYAVLRAAVARAIVGAGLHPALGVHHRNEYDAFALADDAMEPLRPVIDDRVYHLMAAHGSEEDLSVGTRAELVRVLTEEVVWDGEWVSLFSALERYAAHLRACIVGEEARLHCPVV